MTQSSRRRRTALLFLIAPCLLACEGVSPKVSLRVEGEVTWVSLQPDAGFRLAARAAGGTALTHFLSFRAARRVVTRTCPDHPGYPRTFLEYPLPATGAPRTARPGPHAEGIPAASFFQRMPMDDWRTPFDGEWGVSRSGGRRRHKGIDMHADEGAPIYTVAPGTVYRAWKSKGKQRDGGYGNYVILAHDARETSGLSYWTYYTHMLDPPEVVEGDRVPGGFLIGRVGRTPIGRFDNPHLHFEVRHGNGSELGAAVNPTPFGPFRGRFTLEEGAF